MTDEEHSNNLERINTIYCYTYLKIIYDKITSIEIFKKVSNIKNNIVMIGVNGSGKNRRIAMEKTHKFKIKEV